MRLPTDVPVYAATSLKKDELPLADTEPLVVGVKTYQTLPAGGLEPGHDGAGSPGSAVATVVSTLSLKGRAPMAVALLKSSFPGAP
jgi:hypothetical protein